MSPVPQRHHDISACDAVHDHVFPGFFQTWEHVPCWRTRGHLSFGMPLTPHRWPRPKPAESLPQQSSSVGCARANPKD